MRNSGKGACVDDGSGLALYHIRVLHLCITNLTKDILTFQSTISVEFLPLLTLLPYEEYARAHPRLQVWRTEGFLE